MPEMADSPGNAKPHVSSSAVGDGADAAQNEAYALSLLLNKVVEKMNATRRECRAEREELINSVESQLQDMRTETMTTRSGQQQLQREVRAVQEKLQNAVFECAAQIQSSSDRLGVTALAKASHKLHRDTQQAVSEVELLKAAVFYDRLRREERQKADDAEDEELEARLQQAELANEELRRTAVRLRSQNQQLVAVLQGVVGSLEKWKPQVTQQQLQLRQTLEGFARVQAEHIHIVGTVESLVHSVEQYKAKNDECLHKLEKTVAEFEQQQERWQNKRCYNGAMTNSNAVWRHQNQKQQQQCQHHAPEALHEATGRPLRQRLEHFYSIYNAEKIPSVDAIIDEYVGAEEELMAALEVHYGAFGFFSYN
ncbi:hypothetical protein DQ04_02281050 [Trypanosoma grayi]|uniref:hypothetical protein n=1 Tax=Trypanosoma grayi TaxID=71804 RepID=UPI0004F4121A|nr:hypothetical protein DQ04_02281050 [Trypanosoma grayi]KEG11787.1 hypothetical protein DQ04_02281050 [Trypanosoma grayi]